MPPSRTRLLCASLAAFALTGCSYVYDLRAVVIDGRLAFVVDPASDRRFDCINRIEVSVDKGAPVAEPAAGDDRAGVLNAGLYWSERFDRSSCRNRFPIVYGQPLEGVPFVSGDGTTSSVKAKPLRIGIVYEVRTISSGGGYGSGWFRITADRRIENWRSDPTPPDLDENGYDVGVDGEDAS